MRSYAGPQRHCPTSNAPARVSTTESEPSKREHRSRSGRQTEALNALQRARQLLRTAADPGPALRALHDRILHHDPTLLAPSAAAGRPDPVPVTPGAPNERTGHHAIGHRPATAIQIGLHPQALDRDANGFPRHPALTADTLRKTNADNAALLHAAGYRVDACLIETGEAGADTVRRALAAKPYDIVFIGAGIQFATSTPMVSSSRRSAASRLPAAGAVTCPVGFCTPTADPRRHGRCRRLRRAAADRCRCPGWWHRPGAARSRPVATARAAGWWCRAGSR